MAKKIPIPIYEIEVWYKKFIDAMWVNKIDFDPSLTSDRMRLAVIDDKGGVSTPLSRGPWPGEEFEGCGQKHQEMYRIYELVMSGNAYIYKQGDSYPRHISSSDMQNSAGTKINDVNENVMFPPFVEAEPEKPGFLSYLGYIFGGYKTINAHTAWSERKKQYENTRRANLEKLTITKKSFEDVAKIFNDEYNKELSSIRERELQEAGDRMRALTEQRMEVLERRISAPENFGMRLENLAKNIDGFNNIKMNNRDAAALVLAAAGSPELIGLMNIKDMAESENGACARCYKGVMDGTIEPARREAWFNDLVNNAVGIVNEAAGDREKLAKLIATGIRRQNELMSSVEENIERYPERAWATVQLLGMLDNDKELLEMTDLKPWELDTARGIASIYYKVMDSMTAEFQFYGIANSNSSLNNGDQQELVTRILSGKIAGRMIKDEQDRRRQSNEYKASVEPIRKTYMRAMEMHAQFSSMSNILESDKERYFDLYRDTIISRHIGMLENRREENNHECIARLDQYKRDPEAYSARCREEFLRDGEADELSISWIKEKAYIDAMKDRWRSTERLTYGGYMDKSNRPNNPVAQNIGSTHPVDKERGDFIIKDIMNKEIVKRLGEMKNNELAYLLTDQERMDVIVSQAVSQSGAVAKQQSWELKNRWDIYKGNHSRIDNANRDVPDEKAIEEQAKQNARYIVQQEENRRKIEAGNEYQRHYAKIYTAMGKIEKRANSVNNGRLSVAISGISKSEYQAAKKRSDDRKYNAHESGFRSKMKSRKGHAMKILFGMGGKNVNAETLLIMIGNAAAASEYDDRMSWIFDSNIGMASFTGKAVSNFEAAKRSMERGIPRYMGELIKNAMEKLIACANDNELSIERNAIAGDFVRMMAGWLDENPNFKDAAMDRGLTEEKLKEAKELGSMYDVYEKSIVTRRSIGSKLLSDIARKGKLVYEISGSREHGKQLKGNVRRISDDVEGSMEKHEVKLSLKAKGALLAGALLEYGNDVKNQEDNRAIYSVIGRMGADKFIEMVGKEYESLELNGLRASEFICSDKARQQIGAEICKKVISKAVEMDKQQKPVIGNEQQSIGIALK